MHAEVVRRGGMAALTVRVSFDTGQLPESVAGPAEQALNSLPFGQPPAAAQHPHSFRYEVMVTDDQGTRSVSLDEAQLPDVLRDVFQTALTRGRLD